MPENKHAEISKILENDIRSGKYFQRIPPVRALARKFNVSLQTMNKALKPLQNSGLLVSGPGGTRIMENIPYSLNSGVVSVFMLGDTLPQPNINGDPLVQSLRQEADADGVTLVVMWGANEDIFLKHSFWECRQSDGYIFLYSSFYPLLNKHLQVSGIPYLVANWMPDSFNAHYVDWDWKKQLFDLVKLMLDAGYKRIGYLPNIRWKFGVDFHYDMWQDVCSSYDLWNYSPNTGCFCLPPEEHLVNMLSDSSSPPEVIIPANIDCNTVLKLLDNYSPASKILLNAAYKDDVSDPRIIYYIANDYAKLGREIWKVFRQISSGSAGTPRGHLINSGQPVLINNNQ